MPRRQLLPFLLCAALVAGALPACTPGDVASEGTAPPDTAAEHERFGAPAAPDGTLELQDDVVVVGDGRNAVWDAGADGTTWVLDSAAPGMADLDVGDVLLATGYATGRVVELTGRGDRTLVVLAPIELTDLIANGEVRFDQEIDPADLVVQGIDAEDIRDLPEDAAIAPASLRQEAGAAGALLEDTPLPVPAKQFSRDTGGWTLSGGTAADGLHFGVATDANGIKVFGSMALLFDALHVNLGTAIVNSVMGGTRGRISGIQGVQVDLQAGSGAAGGSTFKKEFTLPFEIPVQTVIGGVPMFLKLSTAMKVGAALVGTNATIQGSAQWRFGAPLDVTFDGSAASASAPDLQVVQSLMDSITGIAPGGAVLNLAFTLKMLIGVGAPYFGAGAFGTVGIGVGIGMGSAYGSPLEVCRRATYDMTTGQGVGVVSSSSIVTDLLARVPHVTDVLPDPGLTRQTSTVILHREQTLPDVPICRSG